MTDFDPPGDGAAAGPASSGLELDTSKQKPKRSPSSSSMRGVGGGAAGGAGNTGSALNDAAGTDRRGMGAGGAIAGVGGRPRVRRPADDTGSAADETDSATGGAFIVICLFHILLGLGLAFAAPKGSAVALLAVFTAAALVTYAAYWITGAIARHLGVLGLILFGGWFSLLIGLVAQLVHQLLPWLGWKVLGVVAVVAAVVAVGLDMR